MKRESADYVPVAATFSKDRVFYGSAFKPLYFEEGVGSHVKDNYGKWYIDWVCGLGANFLGYKNIGWEQYVNMHLRKGVAFSLPHRLEYEVAEKLATLLSKHITYWRTEPLQVRWVKTGSAACEAAIRLARVMTGKQHVLSHGYHGWHSDFVAMTPPAHGIIPELGTYMHNIAYNDLEALRRDYGGRSDIAAVIVEQPLAEPDNAWYPGLRRFCDEHNALLIIDEVVTGLRYAQGGACEVYNIRPDLVCMGKALGNGLPIAALIGPHDYLDWFNPNLRPQHDPIFVSSTNAGDVVSLAAANWILNYVEDSSYLNGLWNIGRKLVEGLQGIGYTVLGNPVRSLLQFEDNTARAIFIASMAEAGIIMNRPNFINMAHSDQDVEETITAARTVWQTVSSIDDAMRFDWLNRQPLMLFTGR